MSASAALAWLLNVCFGVTAEFPGVTYDDVTELLQSKVNNLESKQHKALWFTDLHADPYYLTDVRQCVKTPLDKLRQFEFGVMGCDPPPRLLSATMKAVKSEALETNAAFALFTGDYSRHQMGMMEDPYANVSQIIGQVSSIFNQHIPKIDKIFGDLGNDDNPRNYFVNITTDQPTNGWFKTCGHQIQRAHCMTPSTREQYDYGSYFEIRMGHLVVTSSIFSKLFETQHVYEPCIR